MSGSLEINVDTRDFARLQATLERMNAADLDKLLRAAVNEVAIVKVDRLIQNKIASELGILPSMINSRMQSTRSDSRHHSVRSAWLWYGKYRMDGTRLATLHGAVFTPGQVQVGRWTFRNGFWMNGRNGNEVLMQRKGDDRYPIKATKADTDDIVQGVIDSVMPSVPALLEDALDRRIAAYLARL